MFAGVANELIDSFVADGQVDLVTQFTERFPHIVALDHTQTVISNRERCRGISVVVREAIRV